MRLDYILVIAPYNAQVAVLGARLPAGTRIGTVDKFQGQEAPVVICSLAIPRQAPCACAAIRFLAPLGR